MSLPSQSQIQAWWRPRCTGPYAWISLHGKGRVQVRASLWEAVAALNAVLVAFNYLTRAADTGGGNCRPKVSGSGWSLHAFWIAIDLNWSTNPYSRRLITDMPAEMVRRICAIRTKNGKQVWNWGGYWSGNKDAMHHEIVCSPADLAHGIDWSTVWRHSGAAPTPAAPAPAPQPRRHPALHLMEDSMVIYAVIPGGGTRMLQWSGDRKLLFDTAVRAATDVIPGVQQVTLTSAEYQNELADVRQSGGRVVTR